MAKRIHTPNNACVTSRSDARKLRDEAMAKGLPYYFTGNQCKNGHIAERYVSSQTCVMCMRVPPEQKIIHVPKPCSVEGCNEVSQKREMCGRHYQRWAKFGDANINLRANEGSGTRWLEQHANYDGDECLIWPFSSTGKPKAAHAMNSKGYGQSYRAGKSIQAHLHMAILAYGDKRPEGLIATHICGKGHDGCVNPKHLRWSTYKQNAIDRREHGTAHLGSKSWFAKLTEDDVREMRSLADSLTKKQLAEKFGISYPNVRHILSRRTWFHVD